MTEKALETEILDYLNILDGVFAFKINTVGIYDARRGVYRKNTNSHIHNGTADILGVCNGMFFAIEVKWGRNKASDNQKKFLKRVADKGGKVLITNKFDDFFTWFKTSFPEVRMPTSHLIM